MEKLSSDEVMNELVGLNSEGTTVMLVTHDVKVAAKCMRTLYIVDGNIQGEYNFGTRATSEDIRMRERSLNNWLMEMGW